MMFGKHKENGVWIAGRSANRWMWGGGDRIVYGAIGRMRFRLMKPHRAAACSLCGPL
jgi:hypothetical protein